MELQHLRHSRGDFKLSAAKQEPTKRMIYELFNLFLLKKENELSNYDNDILPKEASQQY